VITVQAIAPTGSNDHNRRQPSWNELAEDETFFRLFSADKEDVTIADSTRTFNLFPVAIVLLAALVLHLLPQSAVAAGPEPLTTAAAIARSVVAKTDEPPPVSLEAVVTHSDVEGTTFLRDETGSTFIFFNNPARPRLPRGERVRVEGVVHRGLFINGIRPSHVEPLANDPLPAPKPISPQLMASGVLHYDWVSLEGTGRSWQRTGEETATLVVNVASSIVEARFEHAPADDDAAAWIGARLRLAGIAAGDINDRRQLIRPYLLVPSQGDVTVLEPAPADPFSLRKTAFLELGRGELHEGLQAVSGIAAAPLRDRRLFLTDGEKSLCVLLDERTAAVVSIVAGDQVDAVGFADAGPFATRLAEARVRVTASGETVVPRRPNAATLRANCDAQLIEIEMPVLTREDRAEGTLLTADLDGISMQVVAPGQLSPEIVPAATIRVTAPCLVTKTRTDQYTLRAAGYVLYPTTSNDVVLTASPAWWNVRRLAIALAASLAAGAVGLAWVVLLRRQVRQQLGVIEQKIQSEAVAEERRRIAREFHDSLEQDLAGLALRIDSAAGSITDTDARSVMERQREILARLQDETRQYVWDLRVPARLQGSLADRTEVMLKDLRELTAAPIELSTKGRLPDFPPETTHHLLRMLREAVNNAAHHSGATRIAVALEADRGSLVATVTDDGKGFDAGSADKAFSGHFGIRGLSERARRIDAGVTVDSRPGGGTTVIIRLTVPPTAESQAKG
jgi:signal transduction histidine kinase